MHIWQLFLSEHLSCLSKHIHLTMNKSEHIHHTMNKSKQIQHTMNNLSYQIFIQHLLRLTKPLHLLSKAVWEGVEVNERGHCDASNALTSLVYVA